MRVLLFADVHANWEALLALQRAEPQPDAVLFAGDAAGYGPDPVNCVRWLWANASLAVRGNHDEAVLGGPCLGAPPELNEAAQETLAYARGQLSSNDLAGVRRWPLTKSGVWGGTRFFLAHGTPLDPVGGKVNVATAREAELEALFGAVSADVIVVGHTHLPAIRRFGQRWIVNPGSLGQPRYGTPDATYAVWEDGDLRIRHLHYDHDATARKLRLMGAVGALSPETQAQLIDLIGTGLVKEPLP
jgi:protein phosphatase